MRVLIVEDDRALATSIADALAEAGMLAEVCADGREAEALGWSEDYDAAVLDLGLPGQDGLTVLRRWREQGRHFPVLILTARHRWSDKLAGFEAGADDYLTKPFLQDEVVVRLRALHRRAQGQAGTVLAAGPLAFDTHANRFSLHGGPLALTAQEHRILAYLMRRQGALVSRSEIAEHVYARDLDPDSNTLDVLIGRIRRKLGVALIHTERGLGYRLSHEPDPLEDGA
ncbi:response regulator transcription factor [Aquincola sp. MAHUQ-54]|uniref:Response regulator transcription factor n=1 Tax=Aquincola agrisoli TaxID=3119538 RepID=A0AAW9QGL2_9BURK